MNKIQLSANELETIRSALLSIVFLESVSYLIEVKIEAAIIVNIRIIDGGKSKSNNWFGNVSLEKSSEVKAVIKKTTNKDYPVRLHYQCWWDSSMGESK